MDQKSQAWRDIVPGRASSRAATHTSLATSRGYEGDLVIFPEVEDLGIVNGLARNQRDWGLNDPVDFIFDERPEKEKNIILDAWSNVYCPTAPDDILARNWKTTRCLQTMSRF